MKSTRYNDDDFKKMAEGMASNNDVIETIDRALNYVSIIRKENVKLGEMGYYNSDKYWIPPLSKYKVLLAYIASAYRDILPVLVEVEKLYGTADCADDVLKSSVFSNSIEKINELKLKLQNSA